MPSARYWVPIQRHVWGYRSRSVARFPFNGKQGTIWSEWPLSHAHCKMGPDLITLIVRETRWPKQLPIMLIQSTRAKPLVIGSMMLLRRTAIGGCCYLFTFVSAYMMVTKGSSNNKWARFMLSVLCECYRHPVSQQQLVEVDIKNMLGPNQQLTTILATIQSSFFLLHQGIRRDRT